MATTKRKAPAKKAAPKARKAAPKKAQAGKDTGTGQFLVGNDWWKARSSHGRNPIFKTPEQLRAACEEYFEWCESHPLLEERVFCNQGVVTRTQVAHIRAMTTRGLCLFIGIAHDTWIEWRKSRPDFSEVQREVEDQIYQQKFSGAAADLLNPGIIARDLGLADKQDVSGSVTLNFNKSDADCL